MVIAGGNSVVTVSATGGHYSHASKLTVSAKLVCHDERRKQVLKIQLPMTEPAAPRRPMYEY